MSDRPTPTEGDRLTAVIDLGKTHSHLLLINEEGLVLRDDAHISGSVRCELGYDALDTTSCEQWLRTALSGLGPLASHVRRIIVTTHGAAFVGVNDAGLAFPAPDYESETFDGHTLSRWDSVDDFSRTLSPILPRGLNMGTQLDWLQSNHPEALSDANMLMPYAQYWAWWLTGVASTEVSSMGCHTLLWLPGERTFSSWARQNGWHTRFAPIRKAWEVLGLIRPSLAKELGLPSNVQVHVGCHDSNACLARYLHIWPRMTLVSSGTWVVVMSSGIGHGSLRSDLDQLGNVSVRGDCVPTARFMGGREFALICADADASKAKIPVLHALLGRGLNILPGFATQGGPFRNATGTLSMDGITMDLDQWTAKTNEHERATAASLYLALMTAWSIRTLGGVGPVVLEGPIAQNEAACAMVSALLSELEVHRSTDLVEGTARGAWMLSRWTLTQSAPARLERLTADHALVQLMGHFWRSWMAKLPTPGHITDVAA